MTSENLPVPVPPEPEPPQGLKAWLQYRFLLVVLVIVLFFILLFGLGWYRKAKTAAAPGHQEAPVASHLPEPAKAAPPEPSQAEVPESPQVAPAEPAKAIVAEQVQPRKASHPPEAPHSLAPAPPPPPKAAPVEHVTGLAFTHALAKIMDDQVNKPLFGWRPNTIIFGKLRLTDNVNNLQLGVLDVARRTVMVLNENMTRFAITESYNPQVNEAMNFLMVSSDKYWFPSASGKYREAIQDLEIYSEDLRLGRSRFYNRVDNLIVLFNNYKDLLGSCYHNLLKDTEADGSPVSWFKTDDYFYFSMGVALSMAEMLEAVKEEFHDQLQKKNTLKLLEDAIHALHAASHLNPWIVTDGAKDGILANHRANMSTYIGEAEHLVATMQSVLATN
jgi:hypothetical protein